MKLITLILSLYLLALTGVPCCIYDDCPEEKAKTNQIADHESGDNDCGACSPFFSCTGCFPVSVTVEPALIENLILPGQKIYSYFIQSYFFQVEQDFWQPPKSA